MGWVFIGGVIVGMILMMVILIKMMANEMGMTVSELMKWLEEQQRNGDE